MKGNGGNTDSPPETTLDEVVALDALPGVGDGHARTRRCKDIARYLPTFILDAVKVLPPVKAAGICGYYTWSVNRRWPYKERRICRDRVMEMLGHKEPERSGSATLIKIYDGTGEPKVIEETEENE